MITQEVIDGLRAKAAGERKTCSSHANDHVSPCQGLATVAIRHKEITWEKRLLCEEHANEWLAEPQFKHFTRHKHDPSKRAFVSVDVPTLLALLDLAEGGKK
jgi:hypothetical protein